MSEGPIVLDASALMALLLGEPGSDAVAARLVDATISSVNLSEVAAKLAEHGMPAAEIASTFELLGLDVADFTAELAIAAGLLRPATKALGLSLGDRACLALAAQRQAPAWTTERLWSGLEVGVTIHVAR